MDMADDDRKVVCKYGERCYQTNEAHKSRFWHPTKPDESADASQCTKATKRDLSVSNESQSDNKRFRATATDSTESLNKNVTISINNRQSDSKSNETIHEISLINGAHTNHGQGGEDAASMYLNYIRTNFLVEMPNDVLKFWSFCKTYSSEFKRAPESLFGKLDMQLVGPFDVFAGHFENCGPIIANEYLRHWRFYYDPPEFQTVFVKMGTGIHYGIWRDSPSSTDAFIARNDAHKNGEITIIADNMFSAVVYYLDKDARPTLFNQKDATKLKKYLIAYANQHNISLDTLHPKLKSRNAKSVCKTFHRAGLVVPFDRKTEVGYRPLIETDENLKRILQKFIVAKGDKEMIAGAFDELEPIITAANIACDECDFGNAIELGLDLFCFGAPELQPAAQRLLETGYSMVGKPQFSTILKAHLENRRKNHQNLSILPNNQQ